MNVSALTSLASLEVQSSAQTAITITNLQPITDLLGQTNSLSSAEVNAILIALDGNGLNNGTVDLSGQTPIAPPTTVGALAAVTSLRAKGWTVTVDQPQWLPVTEVAGWIDAGGPANGNLAAFQAAADYATLTDLVFGGTGNLTSIDGLAGLPILATLDVNTNALTTLTLTGCTALTYLDCDNNALTTLNVTGCPALINLLCYSNALTTLNVTGCAALESLLCYSNALTTLNVTGCVALISLFCHNNSLTALNVSFCATLQVLYCYSQYSGGVPVLADLRIGASVNYSDVEANDNALLANPVGPAEGVDDVLSLLATNCLGNAGVCDLNTVGTNASPTGGVLNADYVALTGAGWTVNIN